MIELNENHSRSISITLQLVDRALCEWNDWCTGTLRVGLLYRQLDTLSEAQKNQLRQKIAVIRQLMADLRNDLGLQSKDVPTSSAIAGHASVLWEMLTELNSRGLRAYGAVPEELGAYLDPIGDELAKQMSSISGSLSKSTRSATQA